MSSKIPFVFKSAAPDSPDASAVMPCLECSMLGYGMTCQNCSRFRANAPMTTPSPPADECAFPFTFTLPLATALSNLNTPTTKKCSIPATKQPRLSWFELEAAEPSIKRSRFNWSDMGFSTGESTPGSFTANCNQVQTSDVLALATPPAASRPIVHGPGDYEAWYPGTETDDDEHEQPAHHRATTPGADTAKHSAEQRRFAEFLAAQDEKLPQFSSDRERVAAWIASSSSSPSSSFYTSSADNDDSEESWFGL